MPTIAEAAKNNAIRRSQIIERPVTDTPDSPGVKFPMEAPAPITFAPTPSLPLRAIFPPELFSTDHVTATSQPARPALRTSMWTQPEAASNNATPETLTNKKLITPIIGGGKKLNRYNTLTTSLAPAAVSGNSHATQNFTVSGVLASDKLAGYQWNVAQVVGVLVLAVRVIGNSRIAIDFYNPTGGSLTPTGGSITLFLFQ